MHSFVPVTDTPKCCAHHLYHAVSAVLCHTLLYIVYHTRVVCSVPHPLVRSVPYPLVCSVPHPLVRSVPHPLVHSVPHPLCTYVVCHTPFLLCHILLYCATPLCTVPHPPLQASCSHHSAALEKILRLLPNLGQSWRDTEAGKTPFLPCGDPSGQSSSTLPVTVMCSPTCMYIHMYIRTYLHLRKGSFEENDNWTICRHLSP